MHELQLADSALGYVAEEDPAVIAEWRQRLLAAFASSGRLVGFGHLGLGRIVQEREGFAWRPAE